MTSGDQDAPKRPAQDITTQAQAQRRLRDRLLLLLAAVAGYTDAFSYVAPAVGVVVLVALRSFRSAAE